MKEIIKYLMDNTTYKIENEIIDEHWKQVYVWCKTFNKHWNIYFQNGSMNGDDIGIGHYNNGGANYGLDRELLDILRERPEFSKYIDPEAYDFYSQHYELNLLINKFVEHIQEKENIDDFFTDEEES